MTIGALQLFDAIRDARGLSPTEKLVLYTVASHTSRAALCFASYGTIATESGVHRDTIKRTMAGLRSAAIVVATAGHRPNGSTSSNTIAIAHDALTAISAARSAVVPGIVDPPGGARSPGGPCDPLPGDLGSPCPGIVDPPGGGSSIPDLKDLSKDLLKEQREGTHQEAFQLDDPSSSSPPSTPEAEVWAHFQTVRKRWRKHSRPTLLGTDDRRKLAAQLAAGYDVADLRLAVDGLFGSHWHRENDRLALAYALRSSNIDGFIDAARRETRPPRRDVDVNDAPSTADDTRSADDRNAIVGQRGDEPREHLFDLGAFAAGFEA